MPANADGNPPNRPTPGRADGEGRPNPTPLDALFIVSAAVTLLLFLLWIETGGGSQYSNAPAFLVDLAKSTVAKLSFLGGSAGALLLRKYIDKSPSPNYLIWIPSFLAILIAALFVLRFAMPQKQEAGGITELGVRLSLDKPPALFQKHHQAGIPDFTLIEFQPRKWDSIQGVYFDPNLAIAGFPYSTRLDLSPGQAIEAYIKLVPIESEQRQSDQDHDYRIMLHPTGANPSPGADLLSKLTCVNGECTPAKGDPFVSGLGSGARTEDSQGGLEVVFADEQIRQSREPGWNVPSISTLQKMTDRERVGYTLFDVSFTPEGEAAQADKFYFALRVNDQPIYIDGLSPGLQKERLQPGAVNHIAFGLENLNFTGQYQGYEKLHLSVFFLKEDAVVFRQDLDREYVALRDAAPISAIQTSAGSFEWTGKYVVPKNENKYEVMAASSACGDPPRKDCVDRAVNAKQQFDRAGLKLDGKQVVMVVRPPLRIPPAYGLTLGLIKPSGQVQFTFDADEAAQVCHWAVGQIGQSKAGGLIQANLRRYEVANRGYAPCN